VNIYLTFKGTLNTSISSINHKLMQGSVGTKQTTRGATNEGLCSEERLTLFILKSKKPIAIDRHSSDTLCYMLLLYVGMWMTETEIDICIVYCLSLVICNLAYLTAQFQQQLVCCLFLFWLYSTVLIASSSNFLVVLS
jgi:hypothetical protein